MVCDWTKRFFHVWETRFASLTGRSKIRNAFHTAKVCENLSIYKIITKFIHSLNINDLFCNVPVCYLLFSVGQIRGFSKFDSALWEIISVVLIAELRRPERPPSGAPYPYGKQKETHELVFSRLSWLAALHDDDDGVAQHGGHNSINSLTETCSLCLLCTSLPCIRRLSPQYMRQSKIRCPTETNQK